MVRLQAEVKHIHHHLIDECLSGNHGAFKELYDQYSRQMFSVCMRILQNREEAEDILQEAFLDAFRNLGNFRKETSFGGWLKRIVVNKSLNQLKKKKLQFTELRQQEVEEEQEESDYPELSIQQIQQFILLLPDGYRAILSLYLFEGYSHQEISEALGISVSTSKSQYHRAKQKLKKELIKYHGRK